MPQSQRPFRVILIRWFLAVVAVLGVPVLLVEVQRPFDRLQRLVETTNAVLATVASAVPDQDLARMSRVALALAEKEGTDGQPPVADLLPDDERLAAVAFAFYLSGDEPPPVDEIRATVTENESDLEVDEAALREAMSAWAGVLARDPEPEETRAAFRRTRERLAGALAALASVGLQVDDVYLVLDRDAPESPYFARNVALLIGALEFWDDAVFPSQPIDIVEDDVLFWRASYLPSMGGSPGVFAHNPIHDPILPRFDSDEWGTWFSVWHTVEPAPGQYVSFTVDIDASAVRQLMAEVALAVLVAALLVAAGVFLAARNLAIWVSRPVSELLVGARSVTAGNYDHVVPPIGEGEFVPLIDTFNQMVRGLRERVNLLKTLEKVLSPELASAAAREGLMLGGDLANVTVVFTDFAGFSTQTRNMEATQVVEALNSYFVELVPIIRKWGGFPDKYIGDAIVAIFGAPVRLPDHAERAVRCAIEMQLRLREINDARRRDGRMVFEMRVGVNSGDVVVGAIGCNEKLEYTSIGESTNLANRMESICPIGHVMVADACYRRLGKARFEGVAFSSPCQLEVKGYPEPVTAWPLFVTDLDITRNTTPQDTSSFYVYRRVERVPAIRREDARDA